MTTLGSSVSNLTRRGSDGRFSGSGTSAAGGATVARLTRRRGCFARAGDAAAAFARGQVRFQFGRFRRRKVASRVEGDPFFPIPASHERLPK